MLKSRPFLNYLVIGVMVFMILATAVFVYTSIHLKDKMIYKTVQQIELISELISSSTADLMHSGHGPGQYEMILEYGHHIGIDSIGIYRPNGDEAFKGERKIAEYEKQGFLKAIETMNATGFFDRDKNTYSRYVPIVSDTPCMGCHKNGGEALGVLKIKLSTETDFELLGYMQKLIWTLGLIMLLPIIALLIATAIIREKNRIYAKLKESNKNLKKTYNDLNETEYYLQMILNNSRVIIVTTDTQGHIVEFNKEGENLLEYRKNEIVGKDVLMLYEIPQQRAELMNRGKPIGNEIWEVRNREVRLKSKSGKVFYVTLTLSTMVNENGKIIGTVGVGKDISEQKMLQFKLMQSEKLAGIGTLASGIAHEINNPLAGILGMAEAIRDEDDVRLIKSYTDDIIQYTVHAKNIVKELSSYSRSASNERQSVVSLPGVIENSVKMARHSSSFAGIELSMDLGPECLINANTVEMQQVFVNLIVNAVHAMGDKGMLTITCRKEGTFVKAVVKDTGMGIPEESINKIYDPFFTTKPVGMGTGLGLYVVYKIVTKNGGNIDVESRVGQGTSFILKFPAAAEEHSDESDVCALIGE